MIAIAVPPATWAKGWPNLPEPSCVHLIYVAKDGSPEKDRGLTKRTYAGTLDRHSQGQEKSKIDPVSSPDQGQDP